MIKHILFLLLFLPAFCCAQSTFMKTFGGPNNDNGWFIFEDSLHNFIICGDSMGSTGQVYLLKVDSSGNTLWSRTYGNAAKELARCVKQTIDGNYILYGDRDNFNTGGDLVALIIRTDVNGDSLWSYEMLGTNMSRYGISIITLPDSGFVLGSVDDGPLWQNPYQLSKFDKNGNDVWWPYKDMIASTYFGGNGGSLLATSDGGFVVAGTNEINVQTQDVISLTKSDSSGTIQWYKEFFGNQNCDGLCVGQCSDGGFITAGYTNSYGVGGTDMYVVRTNSNGDSLWARTFGGSGDESICAIEQTTDSGFILFGTSNSYGLGDNDFIFLRLDANGDSLWQKRFGGTGEDIVRDGIITHDGGFAAIGSTTSSGAGGSDVLFIKTDSLGLFTSNKELSNNETNLIIYPNPFSNFIFINTGSNMIALIEIINMFGNISYTTITSAASSNLYITTDDFPSGAYYVRIWDAYGKSSYKMIVKL
jgi:hypothetical protein